MWICTELVPYLSPHVAPDRIVVAGRRPRTELVAAARHAGVDLRADVASLASIVAEASVIIAPITLGAGVQSKIIDAVAALRPCVLTPQANRGLSLQDGISALVRERTADEFGDAILELLADPTLGDHLALRASSMLAPFAPERVHVRWRELLAPFAVGG